MGLGPCYATERALCRNRHSPGSATNKTVVPFARFSGQPSLQFTCAQQHVSAAAKSNRTCAAVMRQCDTRWRSYFNAFAKTSAVTDTSMKKIFIRAIFLAFWAGTGNRQNKQAKQELCWKPHQYEVNHAAASPVPGLELQVVFVQHPGSCYSCCSMEGL